MKGKAMKAAIVLAVPALSLSLLASASAADTQAPFDTAKTYGSVEPIANPTVLNTRPLRDRGLDVETSFADRVFECGVVDQVIGALTSTHAISTINDQNTSFAVGAGGFDGRTSPAFVYTIIDSGANAASTEDISVLTDSLGYVLSQGSAFLLDADNTSSFDFPANYVVLNFDHTPTFQESAQLFETVGSIDPNLFATDTSGYTQYGPSYVSLQSDVPNQEFIDGYVAAAAQYSTEHNTTVEYTPVVGGTPTLFTGGAGFPGNNWATNPAGEQYLARIPAQSHAALSDIRNGVLQMTNRALTAVNRGNGRRNNHAVENELGRIPCPA
jgi:hypothetical protein